SLVGVGVGVTVAETADDRPPSLTIGVVSERRRGDDQKDVFRAALEHEHRHVLLRMNVLRAAGVGGWLALALAFGVGGWRPQWRAPLGVIAAYLGVALVLLFAGRRNPGVLRLGRYAVGV